MTRHVYLDFLGTALALLYYYKLDLDFDSIPLSLDIHVHAYAYADERTDDLGNAYADVG
jgi:hypothetical protein